MNAAAPRTATARQRMLDAALRLFTADGFAATSTEAVCRAAGASNGSFFHHFGSKEGLAEALFLDCIDAYQRAMSAALAGNPPAAAGIRALVGAHVGWIAAHPVRARFMFERGSPDFSPEAAARLAARNARFGETLERWLTPLVAAGALRPAPAELFVAQIIGPAQVIARSWLAGRRPAAPTDMLPALADAAWASLRPAEEEPRP